MVPHACNSIAKETERNTPMMLLGQPIQSNWPVREPVSKTKVYGYLGCPLMSTYTHRKLCQFIHMSTHIYIIQACTHKCTQTYIHVYSHQEEEEEEEEGCTTQHCCLNCFRPGMEACSCSPINWEVKAACQPGHYSNTLSRKIINILTNQVIN